ncbi:TatD family deoxyribonuclease [Parashewanella spongiae]|uniref:TatD family deoxyribonuclease n=1 Tax=Parashewanella spongiae TaxID=342950 RepID=A0A3A6U2S7_9GAMM|nr:TatD family hydrolase [Parashewanella spongiae]MCL1079564.1 TatD family hydrolase [Parashewanella spongiae]RJY07293.1 TatD family deoxyribonuclease [Parashewanella spongiae]
MIDSHAHLDFEVFDHDRIELFKEMKSQGIVSALIPGVSPAKWSKQLQVAHEFKCPFALGIHPWFADKNIEKGCIALQDYVQREQQNERFVAIGECGLDKIKNENWHWQLEVFKRQILLAKAAKLPLIIHAVKAHSEVLELLKKNDFEFGGIIHGFYGSSEIAKNYIKLGFKLGIGGLILNDSAKKLQNTIKELSLEHFVVETDSPAMLPKMCEGNRNTPLLINEIVTKIVDLTQKPTVLVRKQLLASFFQAVDY